MQLAKRLAWAAPRLLLQLLVKSLTLQETTCGPAQMIWPRETTTTTTARRMQTIISKAHRRTCRAPTVERQPQRSGDATCVVKWFAMLAACTSSCTVLIDRTRCVVTQFTHVDVVQRATSQTEEVSSMNVQCWSQIFIANRLQSQRTRKVPNKTQTVVLNQI